MTPTKYIHPTLWRVARQATTDDVRIKEMLDWKFDIFKSENEYDLVNNHRHTKEELLALWFQPVEETTNDWIDKVNKEMEVLLKQWLSLQDYANASRKMIEKHMPKQELIPLDVEGCFKEINNRLLWTWLKLDNTRQEFIKQILSKYCVTTWKRFNRDELEEWYKFHEDFVHWMLFDEAIEHFLATNLLLEE